MTILSDCQRHVCQHAATVWTCPDGYNHQSVGNKVSQIQAVLARRCAAIGELQQHLLQAGWQRGVAQWGVLGQGGQWAAVAGFSGSIPDDASPKKKVTESLYRTMSRDIADIAFEPQETHDLPHSTSRIGLSESEYGTTDRGAQTANVLVRKKHGGGIFVDDPAFLADWSVDGILLVRNQLFRAANGLVPLPYETNWRVDSSSQGEPGILVSRKMPQWACEVIKAKLDASDKVKRQPDADEYLSSEPEVIENSVDTTISDLPLMVAEVSDLLDVMEEVMAIQRQRRLDKLRPPRWLRRNWYIVATLIPTVGVFGIEIARKGYTKEVVLFVFDRISSFFRERLRDPAVAM
jgi:hypothetical protein